MENYELPVHYHFSRDSSPDAIGYDDDKKVKRAHMLLEDVHICSYEFGEKAPSCTYVLRRLHICYQKFLLHEFVSIGKAHAGDQVEVVTGIFMLPLLEYNHGESLEQETKGTLSSQKKKLRTYAPFAVETAIAICAYNKLLRSILPFFKQFPSIDLSDTEKLQHLLYLIYSLLPFLTQMIAQIRVNYNEKDQEANAVFNCKEKEIEAKLNILELNEALVAAFRQKCMDPTDVMRKNSKIATQSKQNLRKATMALEACKNTPLQQPSKHPLQKAVKHLEAIMRKLTSLKTRVFIFDMWNVLNYEAAVDHKSKILDIICTFYLLNNPLDYIIDKGLQWKRGYILGHISGTKHKGCKWSICMRNNFSWMVRNWLPSFLKPNQQAFLYSFIGFCGAAFGSVGRVGDGGISVPMVTLIIGFNPKSANAISKCMIMGAAASTVYYNLKLRHPTLLDMPIIDYDLALLIQPILMLGISIEEAAKRLEGNDGAETEYKMLPGVLSNGTVTKPERALKEETSCVATNDEMVSQSDIGGDGITVFTCTDNHNSTLKLSIASPPMQNVVAQISPPSITYSINTYDIQERDCSLADYVGVIHELPHTTCMFF
ncbi:hypothetical protein Tco_0489965 [Tanacetum coccineum]